MPYQKIFSLFKKRPGFPKFREIIYVLRVLSPKEKIAFFALAIIFLFSSLALAWRINDNFLVKVPARGGELTEGIIGTPRFINPLLAISDADRDMSALIYSGLMRADNKRGLILDLAEKYKISKDRLVYTFTLRPNLVWQDGKPVTGDDIVFTIQQAKNPSLKSPRRASWEGVEVKSVNEKTVEFVLKKPYAPFLENTTIGILPKHIWGKASSERMALSEFNVNPVGSGPYKIESVTKDSSGIITSFTLEPNSKFALGRPYIKKLILKFYPTEKKLISAYQDGNLDNISAISPQIVEKIKKDGSRLKTLSLPRIFGVFFNQNNAKVLARGEVRRALILATDKQKIIDDVLKGFGVALDYPLPPGTFGAIEQPAPEVGLRGRGLEKAKQMLKKNGWKINKQDGVFEKKTKGGKIRLEFSLSTSNIPELKQVAGMLKLMWEKLGAKVDLKIYEIGDLNQDVIRPRKYDALLFGEIVGRDPDPFVFWHSSQRNDPGLNIAMYANVVVDKLLEKARAVSDKNKRKEMYAKFQKEVAKDAPAVFLYSPRFIYLAPKFLKGVGEVENITAPSERFSQIYKWYIKTDKVWRIFAK